MAEHSDLWWWLRGSGTRRMFARALGGGDRPNDTYLSMVTKVLDAVANEVEAKPWKGASITPISAEALAEAMHGYQHVELERCAAQSYRDCAVPPMWTDHAAAILARLTTSVQIRSEVSPSVGGTDG